MSFIKRKIETTVLDVRFNNIPVDTSKEIENALITLVKELTPDQLIKIAKVSKHLIYKPLVLNELSKISV